MRDFYSLAGAQMRRELLDLARHFARANRHELTPSLAGDSGAPEEAAEPSDPPELERWTRFHDEVEQLPAEEREVVSLIFYHGWEQADVADLFQVSVRTVQVELKQAMVHCAVCLDRGARMPGVAFGRRSPFGQRDCSSRIPLSDNDTLAPRLPFGGGR